MTSTRGLPCRTAFAISSETAIIRRCDRKPIRSTIWNGRWYCCAFSEANSHWATPSTGRRVRYGMATDENGAAKSSTTSSESYRQRAQGRAAKYESRLPKYPSGSPTCTYRTPSSTRRLAPGYLAQTTVISNSSTSRRETSCVRSEAPPAPGRRGSSNPKCRIRGRPLPRPQFRSRRRASEVPTAIPMLMISVRRDIVKPPPVVEPSQPGGRKDAGEAPMGTQPASG